MSAVRRREGSSSRGSRLGVLGAGTGWEGLGLPRGSCRAGERDGEEKHPWLALLGCRLPAADPRPLQQPAQGQPRWLGGLPSPPARRRGP